MSLFFFSSFCFIVKTVISFCFNIKIPIPRRNTKIKLFLFFTRFLLTNNLSTIPIQFWNHKIAHRWSIETNGMWQWLCTPKYYSFLLLLLFLFRMEKLNKFNRFLILLLNFFTFFFFWIIFTLCFQTHIVKLINKYIFTMQSPIVN